MKTQKQIYEEMDTSDLIDVLRTYATHPEQPNQALLWEASLRLEHFMRTYKRPTPSSPQSGESPESPNSPDQICPHLFINKHNAHEYCDVSHEECGCRGEYAHCCIIQDRATPGHYSEDRDR